MRTRAHTSALLLVRGAASILACSPVDPSPAPDGGPSGSGGTAGSGGKTAGTGATKATGGTHAGSGGARTSTDGGNASSGGGDAAEGGVSSGTGGATTVCTNGETSIDDGASSPDAGFDFTGSWSTSTGSGKYLSSDHYSESTSATATLHFSGTGVTLRAAEAPHHGIAQVSVDGGAPTDGPISTPRRARTTPRSGASTDFRKASTCSPSTSPDVTMPRRRETWSRSIAWWSSNACSSGSGGAAGSNGSGGAAGSNGSGGAVSSGGAAGSGGTPASGGASGNGRSLDRACDGDDARRRPLPVHELRRKNRTPRREPPHPLHRSRRSSATGDREDRANAVRLFWYAKNGVSITEADGAIGRAIENGMIPILEMHDATGPSSWGNMADIVSYWTSSDAVALVKKYEQHLIINIANEAGPKPARTTMVSRASIAEPSLRSGTPASKYLS